MDSSNKVQHLEELAELITRQIGLYFPKERFGDLERGVRAAAHDLNLETGTYVERLLLVSLEDEKLLPSLVHHLTVGETYFFRDDSLFDLLRLSYFPKLLAQKQSEGNDIWLWSSACCSGEEPYSLAILLKMLMEGHTWNFRVHVIGSDLNGHFLNKARSGIYSSWSLRNTPVWAKNKFFHPINDRGFQLNDDIRELVQFYQYNLVSSDTPSWLASTKFDLIFCRNVLMYFDQAKTIQALKKLSGYLGEESFLILSPTDVSSQVVTDLGFGPAMFSGIYRKKELNQESAFQRKEITDDILVIEPLFEPPVIAPVEAPVIAPLPEVAELYRQAQIQFSAHNYEEARTLALQIVQRTLHIGGMELLARIDANCRNFKAALDWCQKAINLNPQNPSLYMLFAHICEEVHKDKEAIAALQKVLYLDRNVISAHYLIGKIATKLGLIQLAHHHFMDALWLLSEYGANDVIPESGDITAAVLSVLIEEHLHAEEHTNEQG